MKKLHAERLKQLRKQIREIKKLLVEKKDINKKITEEIRILSEQQKKLEQTLTNIKDKNYLTDHCIVRYLERFTNVKITKIKKEILETQGLEEAIIAGANSMTIDGKEFTIRNGKVTTVY